MTRIVPMIGRTAAAVAFAAALAVPSLASACPKHDSHSASAADPETATTRIATAPTVGSAVQPKG